MIWFIYKLMHTIAHGKPFECKKLQCNNKIIIVRSN